MKTIAIVGTGPSALMAAHVLSAGGGVSVRLFEKRKGPGRKLLIAGSSGLNITYDCPLGDFVAHYRGPIEKIRPAIEAFPPEAWRRFIEGLGIPTFVGTSRRYFVEGMKASRLLKDWLARLESQGVGIEYGKELTDFETRAEGVRLSFADGTQVVGDAVCLCLGGGSWEPQETPLRWPAIFERKGIRIHPFESSNVGFKVDWPKALLREVEGEPIKNVVLRSSLGNRSGDLVITSYGLEGTPVYFAGEVGTVRLDLKPDLTEEQIRGRLRSVRENLSPMRRVKKQLSLSPGALALIFHLAPRDASQEALAKLIKDFPIELRERQPLAEAISSSGGVDWGELDDSLMLKQVPGVHLAGEMIDWDAPTGGFLLQASVAQGYAAGQAILRRVSR